MTVYHFLVPSTLVHETLNKFHSIVGLLFISYSAPFIKLLLCFNVHYYTDCIESSYNNDVHSVHKLWVVIGVWACSVVLCLAGIQCSAYILLYMCATVETCFCVVVHIFGADYDAIWCVCF